MGCPIPSKRTTFGRQLPPGSRRLSAAAASAAMAGGFSKKIEVVLGVPTRCRNRSATCGLEGSGEEPGKRRGLAHGLRESMMCRGRYRFGGRCRESRSALPTSVGGARSASSDGRCYGPAMFLPLTWEGDAVLGAPAVANSRLVVRRRVTGSISSAGWQRGRRRIMPLTMCAERGSSELDHLGLQLTRAASIARAHEAGEPLRR